MYISKNKEVFTAVGILWSSCKEFSKELLLKLAVEYKLIQICIYDLGDKYKEFIYDCYREDEEVMSDGYIDEKIIRLLQDTNTQIVAFAIEIENPQYKLNVQNSKLQCRQARIIKEKLRGQYSEKIYRYFLDNIIHLSDNQEESELLREVLSKHQEYVKASYIRKGAEPFWNCQCNLNSYIDTVRSIHNSDEKLNKYI